MPPQKNTKPRPTRSKKRPAKDLKLTPGPRFLGMREAAAVLSVSASYVKQLARDERFATIRLGRRRLVSVAELERFAHELERHALKRDA